MAFVALISLHHHHHHTFIATSGISKAVDRKAEALKFRDAINKVTNTAHLLVCDMCVGFEGMFCVFGY